LPFPEHQGKPVVPLLKTLRKHYKKYEEETVPGVTFNFRETEHGTMLKVFIPHLKTGFPGRAHTSFRESTRLPPPSTRYLLSPRFNIEKVTYDVESGSVKGLSSQTYVYADYLQGSSLRLAIVYKTVDRTPPSFPFVWAHPGGGDYSAIVGWEKFPTGSQTIDVNDKGWTKLPVVEVGYGSR
jgi:hypothetical protein